MWIRGVAQPGRVLRSGRRSRRFESSHPDHPVVDGLLRPLGALMGSLHLRRRLAAILGDCVGKLLLLVLAIAVAIVVLKGIGRFRANRRAGEQTDQPSAVKVEDMVSCAFCGVNFPSGEAVAGEGRFFCGAEHLRRFLSRET